MTQRVKTQQARKRERRRGERPKIIGLTETWLEEYIWNKIRNRLSNKFEWLCTPVTKENKRGKTKGRIMTAICKELKGVKVKEINKKAM